MSRPNLSPSMRSSLDQRRLTAGQCLDDTSRRCIGVALRRNWPLRHTCVRRRSQLRRDLAIMRYVRGWKVDAAAAPVA